MLHDWYILRTFPRSMNLYLAVWALIGFSYAGIQSVLLNLYLVRLGFAPAFIGTLTAVGQLTWALAALPASTLGRRMGLRATLIMANMLGALGFGALLLVEMLPHAWWTGWLVGWWALVWIGVALTTVNSPLYLMQISTAEERAYAFAAQSVLFAVMGGVGSLVAGVLPPLWVASFGGTLIQTTPYRVVLWLVPLSYLVSIAAWAWARPVPRAAATEVGPQPAKPLGVFGFLALVVFLQTAGEGAVRAFFNVYLERDLGIPTAQIGLVFGVGQLVSVVGVLTVPYLLVRWGTARTLALATGGGAVMLVPLATFPHWLPATVGFLGVLAMAAVSGPVRTIFSQEIVALPWRTTTSAIATVGVALGWASTPALGSALLASVGFRGLFALSAALAGVAAILVAVYGTGRRERMPGDVTELVA